MKKRFLTLDAVIPEVILIEDSPDDLDLLLDALRTAGETPKIRVARDGQEAQELLFGQSDPPLQLNKLKLILLDLNLPKISGLEILKELKSTAATQHIPVVVLTTSDEASDVAASHRLGVNSYQIKPMDFDQFSIRVAKIFDYWLHFNVLPSVDGSPEE